MTKGTVWLVAALLLGSVWPSVEAFQQQKPNAVLTGTVLSDDARPVDRAIVSIVGTDRPGVRTTETNALGEFSFDGLPAGSFVAWAAKAGALPSYYGSRDPGRGPTPIAIANGQRLTVSLTMLRGAEIAGRITDPAGRPVSQVLMHARPVSSLETAAPQTSKTDSDGRYLIFGLAPGDYIVEALAPQLDGSARVFAPTFFPSVVAIDQAVTIALHPGERRDDVTFNLSLAARVSGKVVVPNGQLMSGVSIALLPVEKAAKPAESAGAGTTTEFTRLPVSDTGEFSVRGVIPGTYALWGRWDANTSPRAGPEVSTLWGEHEIVVNGPDVSGVVLSLQPGARVSATIRSNAALGTPALEALRFQLLPQVDSTAAFAGNFAAKPDPGGKVVFPSVPPGPYNLRTAPGEITAALSDTWVITSAMASGQDVADGTLDIRPGTPTSDITVTLAETEVSGTVLDAATQPTGRFPLLFFSAARTFWTPGSRRVRIVQPAADSTFRVGGLPPGDYFVVAFPNAVADARIDAVDLDVLAAVAGRITIVSGEKRRVDVTLTSPAESGDVSGAGARFSGTWTLGNSPGLSTAAYEGNANSWAGQLQVGPGTGKLVIAQRGDRLRIESHGTGTGAKETVVEYGLNGQPVRNPFSLGPRTAPPPSEITSWLQGNKLVSTIDVFLAGESVPRHYVETMSISPEGILAVRIERVGFPDTRTLFYRKGK